jgi:hypothetical protein
LGKDKELGFMVKILIQNHTSEVVIHNVEDDDLDFWTALLGDAFLRGDARIIDENNNRHQAA